MFKDKNYDGHFWVENDTENKFHGKINLNEKEFLFTVLNKSFSDISEEPILINGLIKDESLKDKSISFILINNPKELSLNKKNVYTYPFYEIYEQNYNTKEDIKFEKIIFKIDNISSALEFSSLERYTPLTGKFPIQTLTEVNWDKLIVSMEDFTIEINPEVKIREVDKPNGKDVIVEEEIYIIIEYKKSQNLKNIYSTINVIKNLFSFLTGNSNVTEIRTVKDKFYTNIVTPNSLIISKKERIPCFIQLNKNNIERVFRNWLLNHHEMELIYDLFFSIDEKKINPVTLLLTYSQILEGYHRQRYDGIYLPNKEFENLQDKIWRCIDLEKSIAEKKFKDKFSSLCHSNEYSLKDRLDEIFEDLKCYKHFKEILKKHGYIKSIEINDISKETIAKFSKKIKDRRNYYTHYDKNNKKGKLFEIDSELKRLNHNLKDIITLIFLKDLGFETNEIDTYIDNKYDIEFTSDKN